MRGRTYERRRNKRHMPVRCTVTAVSSPRFFLKDGRTIHIGDCALFSSPQDAMPFIGIICRIIKKQEGLSLIVNWLYRPSDVELVKGTTTTTTAPNEVYYSFHKDEISVTSLLHPCKVAFLRKGIELPSRVCSHICRRVYDTENKRLWWLTDRDYINEWQEEVNGLLEKTQREMNGEEETADSRMNVKKRENSFDHAMESDSERSTKRRQRDDDASSVLKSEIASITARGGGLIGEDGVGKLLQLMRRTQVNTDDLIALADVVSTTDSADFLDRFVQRKGLPVLDRWLQLEPSSEALLLAVLRALDRLPVTIDALQSCNVGKSVNHLRSSHGSCEVQRKAKRLIDAWKRSVDAEMNLRDESGGATERAGTPPPPRQRTAFDLNEGLAVDGIDRDAVGFRCFVSVTVAVRGAVVPPERTLSSDGWTGSATTSAFRPARPRPGLGIDLNLPDPSVPRPDLDLNRPLEGAADGFIAPLSSSTSSS